MTSHAPEPTDGVTTPLAPAKQSTAWTARLGWMIQFAGIAAAGAAGGVTVGGGCATKEVAAPGFRHNFHSNFHGIIHMGPVYRDLELERYGARYVWPEN